MLAPLPGAARPLTLGGVAGTLILKDDKKMLDHPLPDIDAWVLLFSNNTLPVLRVTKRRLDEMRADLERVDARELAHVILQDPIMTVRVLAYIQPMRGRALQHDITTIASAVMMAGMEPFFRRFEELPTIEGMLKGVDPHALLGVLQVIRRAQRAADYAQDWAIWRHDVNMEEVRIAALLHDLTEILVWCFAPKLGLEIRAQQIAKPTMRSTDAQKHIIDHTFQDIQVALCQVWHLPELLLRLIDDSNAEQPRVKNVALAVRLARHSSHGWDDPALPDDFTDIGQLLNITPEAVRQRIGLEPMPAREADD
ncbi:HDOD domain-containing protein [Dechloromonas denitrificans]|jgi:HD-like signal output (HDOD) protein|uniref:HDOD domain-containing protein n=1 Tax=Dechloromonas denitrificans TaxID=281362 RepID=UPI001CF916FB|nr:HDOD domain-containing protein [Dechloromonas denitrificans]